MTKPLAFVTGNENKLREVSQILAASGAGLQLVSTSYSEAELPEIQGTPEEVAIHKASTAARLYGGPVLTEDTSLSFAALGGLPGPYIKDFLGQCGHAGLNAMLDGFADRTATARTIFALCDGPGAPVKLFIGETPGSIVAPRSTGKYFGWDPVFEPAAEINRQGQPLATYGEMTPEEKNAISHRRRALDRLVAFLAA
jgi:inosine triphosphate pyrophosphatase